MNMLLELEGGVKMVWGSLLNVVARKGKLEGTAKEYVTDQEAAAVYVEQQCGLDGGGIGPVEKETVKGAIQLVRQPDMEQAGPWGLPKAECV